MSDEKIIDSNLELAKESGAGEGKHEKGGVDKVEKSGEPTIFSPEKEISKEISGAEKDSSYDEILSKIAQNPVKDDDVKTDAEIILEKKMDAQSNVQHLVDLALSKGVTHAVKVARQMDDNYVLDMMHDRMISDEFHRVLIDKKFITNE